MKEPDYKQSKSFWVLLGVVAGAFLPSFAEAHLVTTGLGPIYDGISHVLMSPDDLLPILALSTLSGLNGPMSGRRTLFGLAAAWLVGGIAGYMFGRPISPGVMTCVSFLVLGGLTAADLRLSPTVVLGLALAVGMLHGWLNGTGIAAAHREALGLVGITGTIFVLVAIVSAFVISLSIGWTRIAVRVAGSWVAAIGLLILGWNLR
jgi:hydrogenase/urease accessory protein HupE